MFGRFEALAIKTFFTAQLRRLTTFDHNRAWNKLQADLYKKQASFLDDVKAILANPAKINAALNYRQSFSGSGSRKSLSNDYLAELCKDDFNPSKKIESFGKRVTDFMQQSFAEFATKDSEPLKQLTESMAAETAQDSQRVAIILDAVCFYLSQSYYHSNAALIQKIAEAKGKECEGVSVSEDELFLPATKQKKIHENYAELKELAERAILTQRLKSTPTDAADQKQALQLQLLQKEVTIATQKVTRNKGETKTNNPYGFFADKNYAKQQAILASLSRAKDVTEMGRIAEQYKHLPYIACSPTMGPLLRSISNQAKQLNTTASKAQRLR